MAIKIEYDRICIGNFVLCEDANGVVFDGKACSNQFIDNPFTQGIVSGYTSGGDNGTDVIDKFPFTADANATDVGELSVARKRHSGLSSTTDGFVAGGSGAPVGLDSIDKFPFTADAPSFDVGELSDGVQDGSGQSSSVSGYTAGRLPAADKIQKFPFANGGTGASDVGDLTNSRGRTAGHSSPSNGYASGGSCGSIPTNCFFCRIDCFPFSADTPATNIGNLTQTRGYNTGQQSSTHGYSTGGINSPPDAGQRSDVIDKFPFASSNDNATDVGELAVCMNRQSGQSSTTNGYASGGFFQPPDGGTCNTIQKFPFAADTSSTDIANLTVARYELAGHQV